MATGKLLKKPFHTNLASLRKSKKKGSKIVSRSSEAEIKQIEESPRKGSSIKNINPGKLKAGMLMSTSLRRSRKKIKGLSKKLFQKSKKKGLPRSDTSDKLETIAATSSISGASMERYSTNSTSATREEDSEESHDGCETPPPSLIEVSDMRNKVPTPPISAESKIPLQIMKSEPPRQTVTFRSVPLGVELAGEENGVFENSIAATNTLSLLPMESASNLNVSSDNEEAGLVTYTTAAVNAYRENEALKKISLAMDTFFLPVVESKSNFEASNDTELTWFQQMFVSCRGGEEGNKVGVIS